MNHKIFLLPVLAIVTFTWGCDIAVSQHVDAKTAARELTAKDYTFAQKTEFTESMLKELAAINQDLDQLGTKIEKSSAAVRAEAQSKLQVLHRKAEALRQRLDRAKDATESTWDTVKAGSQKAYEDLKDEFTLARLWASREAR